MKYIYDKLRKVDYGNIHLKNLFNFGLGTGVATIISFLTIYILNSNLTEKDMGEYSYTFNILTLVCQIVSLNIYSSYLRFYHSHDNLDLRNKILRFLIMSSLVLLVGIYVIYDDARILIFVSILFFEERLYFYRAKLKIHVYNVLNLLQKITYFILIYLFFWEKTEGSNYSTIIMFLGISYLAVLFSYLLFKKFAQKTSDLIDNNNRPKLKQLELLKFSFLTMLVLILSWVLSVSDQIFIKHYFGAEELAPYAVCFRIISMIGLISGVFISYYPTLYFREFTNGSYGTVKRYRRVFSVLLLLTVLVLTFTADLVFIAFGAEKYSKHIDLFIWLIWGEFFRLVASLYMTYQTFILKQKNVFLSLFIVALLNVCLNYIFIPLYGTVGAAISTLISYIVYFCFSLFFGCYSEWKYIKRNEV